jgi:RNA polymerase sigma factor (sigma-70 family)
LNQDLTKDRTTQLVELCKLGNNKAQYELYNRYVKAMFNTALRIVRVREEAEDVIQESFLDGFLKIDRFRGESTFGAWLKSIVVNKAIAKLRAQKMNFEEIENGNEGHFADTEDLDFEENKDTVCKIKKALNALPDGFRLVLSLYLFEGYDHQEIGQILGINEATSRSQYLRGKVKLVEILKER